MATLQEILARQQNRVAQPSIKTATSLNQENKGGVVGGVGFTLGKVGVGLAQGLEGIYDFIVGGAADILGFDDFAKEQFETNPTQEWSRNLDDWYNPGDVMEFIGNVGESIGQMLPAVALTAATGGVGGTVAFGVSAAGRGVQQAVQKTGELGIGEYGYGIGSGALETAIEMVSGGIGGLGKGVVDDFAKQIIKNRAIRGAVGEGLEEVASGILDPYLQRATYDKTASLATPKSLAMDFALGAVAGGIMQGLQLGANVKIYGKEGSQLNQEVSELASMRDNQLKALQSNSQKRVDELNEQIVDKVDNIQKLQDTMVTKGVYDEYAKKIGENAKGIEQLKNLNVNVMAVENAVKGINTKYKTNYTVEVFDESSTSPELDAVKASMNTKSMNGFIVGDKIYINKNADAYNVVLGHELKHSLEKSPTYKGLHSSVLSTFDSNELNKIIEAKTKMYQSVKGFASKSVEAQRYYIEQEVVADYIGNTLFSDYKSIKSLYKSNRSVFQRVYAWLSERLGLSKTSVDKAKISQIKKLFDKAMQEQSKEKASEEVKVNKDNVKFSITDNRLVEKYPNLDLNQDISKLDGVPAIRLNDGSIIPFNSNHIPFIKIYGIDVNDIESGGWIGNGEYNGSIQSDTMRYVEREQARQRVNKLKESRDATPKYSLLSDKDSPYYDKYTDFRGEVTKDKILVRLKETMRNDSTIAFVKELKKFDSAEEIHSRIFYHGTGNFIGGSIRPSIALPKNTELGGGYDQRYYAISASRSKNVAKNFSPMKSYVNIYTILLRKDAKVIEMSEIEDSVELEDYIVDLWKNKVDAVLLKGFNEKGFSEQEIAIINPRAVLVGKYEQYRTYNIPKLENWTVEDIKKLTKKSIEEDVKFSLDSDGNTLSQDQQSYFEDSKIRDEQGKLLKVYHGTTKDFNKFKTTASKNGSLKGGLLGDGFYFAIKNSDAKEYGSKVLEAYLNIKKPFVSKEFNMSYQKAKDMLINAGYSDFADTPFNDEFMMSYDIGGFSFISAVREIASNYNVKTSTIMKKLGYDGLDFGNEFVAFEPNQIKLTTNENPTKVDDIRYSIIDSKELLVPARAKELANIFGTNQINILHSLMIPEAFESLNNDLQSPKIQERLNKLGYNVAISDDIRYSLNDDDFDDIYDMIINSREKDNELSKDEIDDATKAQWEKEDNAKLNTQMAKENLYVMRKYMRGFNLSGIRKEILYYFDKDRSPFMMWGKSSGGASFDSAFYEINEKMGNPIEESQNEKDNFINFHKYYVQMLTLERNANPIKVVTKQPKKEAKEIITPKGSRQTPITPSVGTPSYQPRMASTLSTIERVGMKEKQVKIPLKQQAKTQSIEMQIAFTNAQAGIEAEGKRLGIKDIEAKTQRVRSARAEAANMIVEGQYSANNNQAGKALNQITQMINEEQDSEFQDYLLNYHNMDRVKQGKPVFEDVTSDESLQIVLEYEGKYPQFKDAAKEVWRYSKNLLQLQVDTGVITKELQEVLNTMYPHYVPTYRVEDGKVGSGAVVGDYNLALKSTVRKAKGGSSAIISLWDSLATQSFKAVRTARMNQLATSLYNSARLTQDFQNIEILKEDVEVSEIEQIYEDTTQKDNEVNFFEKGVRKTMRVAPTIFKGFKAYSPNQELTQNAVVKVVRGINNTFKKLVTSLNPFFLVRNGVRDLQDAALYSKHPQRFIKNYSSGVKDIQSNNDTWKKYKAAGGFQSSLFENYNVNPKGIKGVKNVLRKIENLNMMVEQLPRYAEFKSSLEAGDSVEQALLNAADVTVNFGRTGTITRLLNSTLIPFLNPAVQGFSKLMRTITGVRTINQATHLIARAALVGIIPAILNDLLYDDDDEYIDLNARDKENNYLIKVGTTFIKIPKGRVASILGGLGQRTVRAVKSEDDAFKGYGANVLTQVTPVDSISRTIFSPFQDVATNRTWYGGTIEGMKFDKVSPKMRYDETTSKLAIALGNLVNYSPKKIHYLLDSYTGVIGDVVLPMTTPKLERNILQQNFFIDPTYQNKISQTYYDEVEAANFDKSEGDMIGAAKVKFYNKVNTYLKDLYKKEDEIMNSGLSNVDKKTELKALKVLISQVQKTALQDVIGFSNNLEQYDLSNEETFDTEYMSAFRDYFGAERTLREYNQDVYDKASLLNNAKIDYESFYDIYFALKDIDGDKDAQGNTIAGSRKLKVEEYVKGLKLSAAQKYIVIGLAGYKNKNGDALVKTYIQGLKLTKEQKEQLYVISGY